MSRSRSRSRSSSRSSQGQSRGQGPVQGQVKVKVKVKVKIKPFTAASSSLGKNYLELVWDILCGKCWGCTLRRNSVKTTSLPQQQYNLGRFLPFVERKPFQSSSSKDKHVWTPPEGRRPSAAHGSVPPAWKKEKTNGRQGVVVERSMRTKLHRAAAYITPSEEQQPQPPLLHAKKLNSWYKKLRTSNRQIRQIMIYCWSSTLFPTCRCERLCRICKWQIQPRKEVL